MNELPDQRELIHETDWSYFLILDAMRYDLAAELAPEILPDDARLSPAWSPASNTLAWLIHTFPDEHDIVYVSGHALINSQGITRHDSLRRRARDAGLDPTYDPSEHFHVIRDVWEWGYDAGRETVPPEAVNAELREWTDADRPVIGHYVQPHFPWARGDRWASEQDDDPFEDARRGSALDSGATFSKGNVEAKLGVEGVELAYKDNLVYVLLAVNEILDDIDGTVVVTSDHGARLETYDEPPTTQDEEMRKVPWIVYDA